MSAPYYQDDLVTLYHGDCREFLPAIRADGVVTDPPYGTEGLGDGYGRRQLANNGARGHVIANDGDLSVFAASAALWHDCLLGHGWVLAFCAPRRRRDAESVLLGVECAVIGEAIWDKGRAGLGYTVRYAHETVLIGAYGDPKPADGPLLSVLHGKRTSEAMSERHPHEKPVDVCGSLIRFAVAFGGVVLDPFAGSGSTLVAAKNLGRRAIGIELDERHCATAAARLSQGALDLGGAA